MTITFDPIDREIIRFLQSDGKLTIKELASKLGLTNTPVHERIKRLERSGVIKRYAAIIDRQLVGLSLVAYCNVSLENHKAEYIERFERDVLQLQEVIECYHIAGLYDYLLKIVVPDMATYQEVVAKKLAALEYIGRVQSSFVMNVVKEDMELPV